MQVRAKGQALVRLLQQGDAALQVHAMLSLASRLVGQCEAQVRSSTNGCSRMPCCKLLCAE